MVVGCVLKETENGEYVVDNKKNAERLKKIFPPNTEAEKELLAIEEEKLRKLLEEKDV